MIRTYRSNLLSRELKKISQWFYTIPEKNGDQTNFTIRFFSLTNRLKFTVTFHLTPQIDYPFGTLDYEVKKFYGDAE